MKIEMRLAIEAETQICSKFIEEAREYQQQQGFIQWTKEYPNMDTISEDIHQKKGYILIANNLPFGYLCIDFTGEPAYEHLEGKWLSSQAYAVVHRLAIGKLGRGKGTSKEIFHLVKELCRTKGIYSIRVDTDQHNLVMQHILESEGYQYCGTVIFQNSSKLAYELDFDE